MTPFAVGVDGLRDELLARPALAGDEHCRVGWSDAQNAPDDVANRLRPTDQVLEFIPVLELGREQLHLGGQLALLHGSLDLHEQLLL